MKKSFWCGLTAGLFVGYYICEYRDEIKEVIAETEEKFDDFLEETGISSVFNKAFETINDIKGKVFEGNLFVNEFENFEMNPASFEQKEIFEDETPVSPEKDEASKNTVLEDVVEEDEAFENTVTEDSKKEFSEGMILGNTNSMVCHRPDCRYAPKKEEIIAVFDTAEQAEAAGYKKCSRCLEA